MNHRIAIILALISVIVALAPAIAASPIISIDSYTIDVNSNVTVPVVITNLSAVAGGSVEILFDPSIVNVQEVLAGDFGAPVANISNTNGSVHVAVSRATAVGKDNYASLASIKFKGVSKGITALNIANAYLNYENYIVFIPETSDGKINVRVSSDGDTDSDTDSHNNDGHPDLTTDSTVDDDSVKEKEEEKVSSNEPTAINIGSYSVYENTNVTVPIEITHASAAAGGSANITFNPLFVNVEEVLPGDFGTPIANVNNNAGFVYIACALSTAMGKDKAKLASVRFKGVSKGVTTLNVTDAYVTDETGHNISYPETSGGEIEVRAPISTPALTSTPSATANKNITAPVSTPAEHGGLFIIAIIIVACSALAGSAIVLLRRRKKRWV